MLATMSGGLPSDDPWADREEAMADASFDELLRTGVQLAWVPGTAFEYSNLGYALLGRAIQVAAGRRFHDVVVRELIVPLGLRSTAFTSDVAASGGVAIGHRARRRRLGGPAVQRAGAFSPIGGLFGTVTDLARWVQFFVDAHHGDGAGPLSAASRREMQQGYRLIPPDPKDPTTPDAGAYGFGLVAGHDPDHGAVVSHAGEYPGFSASIGWHPATGIGVVALENATYAGVSRVAGAALRDLLAAMAAAARRGSRGPPPSPRRRRSCGCSANGTTPSPLSSSATTWRSTNRWPGGGPASPASSPGPAPSARWTRSGATARPTARGGCAASTPMCAARSP